MRVSEIMSTAIQQIGPDMSADTANNLPALNRIRHLAVTEGARLKGSCLSATWGVRAASRRERTA